MAFLLLHNYTDFIEYMIAEKGYDAQVSLSNINLRY